MQPTNHTLGLIIGGIIPAIFFGLSGVFAKPANQLGIGTGVYIIIVGTGAILTGLIFLYFVPDNRLSFKSATFAFLVGLCWAIAAGFVALAINKYSTPISQLVPLFNTNTLIAVVIGLFVFNEYKDVNSIRLIIGALLIVVGSIVVSKS